METKPKTMTTNSILLYISNLKPKSKKLCIPNLSQIPKSRLVPDMNSYLHIRYENYSYFETPKESKIELTAQNIMLMACIVF